MGLLRVCCRIYPCNVAAPKIILTLDEIHHHNTKRGEMTAAERMVEDMKRQGDVVYSLSFRLAQDQPQWKTMAIDESRRFENVMLVAGGHRPNMVEKFEESKMKAWCDARNIEYRRDEIRGTYDYRIRK